MEYHNLVVDFANRTLANLDTLRSVQNQCDAPEIYEVTQLINSMLGLLVFPQQSYVDRIPQKPICELIENGWPIPKTIEGFPPASDLRQLFRYLRNGIAHFNIQFLADDYGNLCGLKIWNSYRGKPTWKAILDLDQLEGLTRRFVDLLVNHYA